MKWWADVACPLYWHWQNACEGAIDECHLHIAILMSFRILSVHAHIVAIPHLLYSIIHINVASEF